MSDTTENTNELDSYGVWVKNNNQEGAEEDLNFSESLDLPDFEESDSIEDSDFADMFKEDDTLNLDSNADDTTLTDDELMNITSGDGIQIEETSAEDNSDLDDISFDSLEENSVSDADLSNFDQPSTEEQSSEIEDASLDEFNFEEISNDSEEPVEAPAFDDIPVEETASEPAEDTSVEEMNIEDFGVESTEPSEGGEEEISLDDFMDSGFSDESVASGNNGFAADAAPSSDATEEVSLDDFVDMSEFGVSEDAPKKEETIVDEKPLDMNISFDSSADTIQTEENDANNFTEEEDFEEEADFTSASENEEQTETSASTGDNIESEEVDLSDFGIDADAEETPVTQDVEDAKSKETVVDYDLSVENANMNAAPVVNEIKSSSPVEEISEIEEVDEVSENNTPVDNSLLQQIVADLSNLKEEINNLKNNLEEMKASPAPAGDSSGIISEEIAVDDEIIEDDSKEDTGFFSGDDGDDTIALSTDELSNILNTADFSQDTEEATVEESPAPEEENLEVESNITEDSIEAIEDKPSDISFDFEEENLSEPNLDEIEMDEDDLEEDLPDEIEITKEDDILVESSSSDFMDSVQDTTDEHEPEDTLDSPEDEIAMEEAPVEDEAFSTVDNLFEDTTATEEPVVVEEEPVAEEEPVVVEEPAIEDETFVEEPAVEEEIEPTPLADDSNAFIDNDFVSHEDDNNELTDSNIDYLTTEENNGDETVDENAELKKDIKSVLLYMDQLLENLPEEKIVEFAKSDEFTTYKKLFSELGLS